MRKFDAFFSKMCTQRGKPTAHILIVNTRISSSSNDGAFRASRSGDTSTKSSTTWDSVRSAGKRMGTVIQEHV